MREKRSTEGRVLACTVDTARVDGLSDACFGDVVGFGGGGTGLVTALWRDSVEIALLDAHRPAQGARARLLGPLELPAGDDLVGRIVDGLGRPLDGGRALNAKRTHRLFFAPPRLPALERGKRLTIGLLVYDLRTSLAAGFAILASGSASAGITQHILRHQAHEGRVVIYARPSAGGSATPAARLLLGDALSNCIVVESRPGSAPGARWLVPWSAMAIGAAFRQRGCDAVVILDGLDAWLAEMRHFTAAGSRATQLGQLANHACAAAGGSLSLIALASRDAALRAAPMFDTVLDLGLALRGVPAGGETKLVRPPLQLDGKRELGGALTGIAMYDEIALGMPWLMPGGAPAPNLDRATREGLDHALRVRECLKFRPGLSVDCVEQLVALTAVCDANDLPARAVPAFVEAFLARVRTQYAGLLAGVRERRHYRDEDHAVLRPLAKEVSRGLR